MTGGETYVLVLRARPANVPAINRLRMALKRFGRNLDMQCLAGAELRNGMTDRDIVLALAEKIWAQHQALTAVAERRDAPVPALASGDPGATAG